MNQADAESTLASAGFTPNVVYAPVTDAGSDGVVIDETPKPNTKAKPGTVVTIHVGQLTGAAPPTTTGTTTDTTTPTTP
jgi:beta-lactam-binding protein with PASTA domain